MRAPKLKPRGDLGQRLKQEERSIAQQLIRALEDAQGRPEPSQDELASRAYEKLQFDWPVLSIAEVDALSSSLRSCLESKGNASPPRLSHMLVSNVTQAVLHTTKPDPAGGPAPVTTPSAASVVYEAPASGSSNRSSTGEVAPAVQAATSWQLLEVSHSSHAELAASYQRLCAVLLLQLTNSALQLPAEELCLLMSGYQAGEQEEEEAEWGPSELEAKAQQEQHMQGLLQQFATMDKGQQQQAQEQQGVQSQSGAVMSVETGAESSTAQAAAGTAIAQPQDTQHQQQQNQEGRESMANGVSNVQVDSCSFDDDDIEYEAMEDYSSKASGDASHGPTSQPFSASAPGFAGRLLSSHQQLLTQWGQGPAGGRMAGQAVASWLAAPSSTGGTTPALPQGLAAARRRLLHLTRPEHLATLTIPIRHHLLPPLPAAGAPASASTTSNGAAAMTTFTAAPSRPKSLTLPASSTTKPALSGAAPVTTQAASSSTSQPLNPGLCYLWEDPGVRSALVQLVRTLGVHEASGELQPLLPSYLGVAVDWAAAAQPRCCEALLSEVWDALGGTRVASMPRPSRPARRGTAPMGPVLLPEARLALGMVVQLASKLAGNAAGRAALWRAVHAHMLPVLDRCLADIATAAAATAAPAAPRVPPAAATATAAPGLGSNIKGQPELLDARGQLLDALGLVCQVVLYYLEQRPGGSNASGALQACGVLRGLCALLPGLGSEPAAEPLRCALLLCCACSASALTWTLAVPGVRQVLEGPAMTDPAGCAAAHGVAWQLLLLQQHSGAAGSTGTPAAAAPSASAGADFLLVRLLQGAGVSKDPDQVRLLHDSLQLLSRMWRACDRDQRMRWPVFLDRAMRDALARLKAQRAGAMPSPTQNSTTGDGKAVAGAQVALQAQGRGTDTAADGNVNVPSTEFLETAVGGEHEKLEFEEEGVHTLVALGALQVRQWEAASAACLKELLLSAGKAD